MFNLVTTLNTAAEFQINSHPNSSSWGPAARFASHVTRRIKRLSAGVDDNATSNGTLLHELVDALELTEADGLEGDGDEALAVELNGLCGVGTVADVAALDVDHADDGVEDGSGDAGIGRETDANDGSAGADVLGSLLEGLLADSDEEDSVGAQAVGGGGLDLGDEVGGLGEVDEGLGTELLAKSSLLITTVNGNGVQAHGLGVLEGNGTETTTGTDDGDSLAGAGTGLLETLVDGDTGAENGGDGLKVALLGDASDVDGLGNGVLLERAVDGVSGEESLGAEGLIRGLAVAAAQARAVEPLDTGVVTDLDVVDKLAASNDNTGTLVATDKGQLGVEGPVTHHGVEIGVADTGVLDIDEDLIGTGLLDGDLLVLGGSTVLLDNLRPLHGRDLRSGHFVVVGGGYQKVVVVKDGVLFVGDGELRS